MGWSVWMIQFMGRWAASSVLEYIEEALSEVTASWARTSANQRAASSLDHDAGSAAGSSGGCPRLSLSAKGCE